MFLQSIQTFLELCMYVHPHIYSVGHQNIEKGVFPMHLRETHTEPDHELHTC